VADSRVDPALMARLEAKLGLSKRRLYELIDERVRSTHLPRRQAALSLASQRGINISRFANSADMAALRGARPNSDTPANITNTAPAESDSRSAGARRVRTTAARAAETKRVQQRRKSNTVFVVVHAAPRARRPALGVAPGDQENQARLARYVGHRTTGVQGRGRDRRVVHSR
jgi:hypothetical protein